MNLDQLITALQRTRANIGAAGRDPNAYPLTLQIETDPGVGGICAEPSTIEWDNNTQLRGIVINGRQPSK